MIGDAVIPLIDSGVITGREKSVDVGLHVASALIGTKAVADWVRERDDVVLVASNYSHGANALSRQDRFFALNSAIEVAMDGAINAEMVGSRVVSGPGGQPDFALGASLASGGKSVVALPSTAQRGKRSRIVSAISPGAPVTVPRHLADYVVTEHGVATLRGANISERRDRLRAITEPQFRL